MSRLFFVALACICGIAINAQAQTWPNGVTDKVTSKATSTASGNCLAANPARKTLVFDNKAGTIAIGYCETDPTTPATPCTAVIGTTGSTTTLAAGELQYFVPAPQNQFCFIAASSTPSFTIREGQ